MLQLTETNLTKFLSNMNIAALKKDAAAIDIDSRSFEKQLEVIRSKDTNITVCCTRRAGKTVSLAYKLIVTALSEGNTRSLYITDTCTHAQELLWDLLLDIFDSYNIAIDKKLSTMTIKLSENGSIIKLSGANNESQIKKVLGFKHKLVVIDEAQDFSWFLEKFCVSKIIPTLMDQGGQLVMAGTPNEFCKGFFYDCCHNDAWTHFGWSWKDNKFFVESAINHSGGKLTTKEDILSDALNRMGQSILDHSVRREWFGEWVKDTNMLIFDYNPDVNSKPIPKQNIKWKYVLGADIGLVDSCAIVVWGYEEHSKICYLVEEWCQNFVHLDTFAAQIKILQKKYRPYMSVMDAGALGALICESMPSRYGVSIHPAEKNRKREYIELMNADFKRGRIIIDKDTEYAKELMSNTWDRNAFDRCVYKEDERQKRDLCDAGLYAWRWAYSYLQRDEEVGPVYGSAEWEEREMYRRAQESVGQNNSKRPHITHISTTRKIIKGWDNAK